MKKRQKSILALAIITAFVALFVFSPELISAGSLEPTGPPGSTMKTLDQIPPTWSQKLPAAERFELVMDDEAVLDKETGLVWEKFPATTEISWYEACFHCYDREVNNRKGWRLPTIEELASLVDNNNSNPALPTGHPFSNVTTGCYWSSTSSPTVAYPSSFAMYVSFSSGSMAGTPKSLASGVYMWCVRGGHGHDTY